MFDFFGQAITYKGIRQLNTATNKLNISLERLATGYKINRAADGPASLAISETLRGQMRGSQMAMENVQQGISMLDTADSAMQTINDTLQRINEIAVAAQNGTVTTAQFSAYQSELTGLYSTIDSLALNTDFNGLALLDGTIASGASLNIQAGPNAADNINIASAFSSSTASALGFTQTTLASVGDASGLASDVRTAMGNLNSKLATVGAYQNRMDSTYNVLSIAVENYTAAENKIRNTDVALETANMTRYQIIQQSAAYVLSQSTLSSTNLLRLLGIS